MNIKEFKEPSGTLTKDGLESGETYHYFTPHDLPPKIEYDNSMVSLLSDTISNFSKLAGMSTNLPNPYILMIPYMKKEAVSSSKIEGTLGSLMDLFIYESEGKKNSKHKEKEKYLGLKEIANCVTASEKTLAQIRKGRRINLKMIKDAHKILLRGVRGNNKNPGKFRTGQNGIGPYENCPIEELRFIPPSPEQVPVLMSRLLKFIEKSQKNIPALIQAALIHYQFETIHPFEDGNGRLGRLLITMYFCQNAGMTFALLYLSDFFEKHNKEYIARLLKVSQESDWNRWIKYFLTAVNVQSQEAMKSMERIIKLRKMYKEILRKERMSENIKIVVTDLLFRNPYVSANNVMGYIGVSHQTAVKIIKTLENIGILIEYTRGKRNKIYKAVKIDEILENT